jgi:hypothetical protein
MCNLVDEKYPIALFIQSASTFTFKDISDGLKSQIALDAAYAVLGELLEKGFIEVSQLIITEDEQVAKLYKIVPNKSTELSQYVMTLAQQRLLPDAQGKPRGNYYRKSEAFVKRLVSSQEPFQEQEKEILLTKLHNSLKWAQEEIVMKWPEDIRQAVLSEAYLRTLYAEYLGVQEGFWAGAILHLLIACRMFAEQGLHDQHHLAEQRACEIFFDRYNAVKQKIHIPDLLDFANTTDKIIGECSSSIFIVLARYVLDEISHKINYLSRSTNSGDIVNVINKSWTISSTSSIDLNANSLYKSLNDARLYILNNDREQGKKLLREALSSIEIIREENVHEEQTPLELLLREHLISLELYDLLNNVFKGLLENNDDQISNCLSRLEKLTFDGLFPFYIADILEKVKLILNFLRNYADELSQKNDATPISNYGPSYPKYERANGLRRENIAGSRDNFDFRDLASWQTPNKNSFPFERPREGFSLGHNSGKNNAPSQDDYQDPLQTEHEDNQALSLGTTQGIRPPSLKINPLDSSSPEFIKALFSLPSLPVPDRGSMDSLVSIPRAEENDSQSSIQLRVTRSR